MLVKLRYIKAVLFCEIAHAIYVYNSGNPNEYLNVNSEEDPVRNDEGEKYRYPSHSFGDVQNDYGIVNISLLASQNNVENPKRRRSRIGFYNVQTGDEFFLNDFEVRPKFKTKQNNRDVLGYEYNSDKNTDKDYHVPVQETTTTTTKKPITSDNPRVGINMQQRPRPQINNNRRKNNNKTTNNRRKPVVQNTKKQQNQNGNRRPTINRNKIKKNNQQVNKRRPQQTPGCRNPNIPLKNVKNRRPTNNNKNTLRPQNHAKPVRRVNNRKQAVKIKNNNRNGFRRKNVGNRKKMIQSRDSNNISDVIKKYISKLKSKDFDNSIEESARSLNGRQRSLFTMALNQIRNQSMNFANQFLSFFTVVQYPNYQCIADSDFNYYEGVCYQEKQCLKLGGTPLGNCSSYDVCCVFKSSCGDITNQNCTYLESPNYPKYFPNNDTENPDVFFDDPSYEEEEGETETPIFDNDYEIEQPLDEEEPSLTTISTSSIDGIGDEFFVETDSLSDIPSMIGEDTTESIEDFDLSEDIDRFEQNRYKEYAIGRTSRRQGENLAENFACSFKIFKTSEKVQEMKVEFIDLELLGPTRDGDCLNERLMISGQNLNLHVPIICGYNSGQHVYVDVSTLTGPLQISILSNDVYTKRYKLRVCQLETPCVNTLNCLQYYSGTEGIISSFNYDQAAKFPRSDAQYLNNLNYAICIRRQTGYCSTTFTNVDEENVEYPFEIINQDNDPDATTDEFSIGPEGCPHDYIVINNMRICGRTFKPITEEGSGPIIVIPFHSNQRSTGAGFKLVYTQNKCTN